MRRVRTTKTLAKRIDLQYFSRPHPFRRWRLWLSVAIPVVALGWFVAQRATGQKVYSSGPLSFSHAVLGKRCEVCHVTQAAVFRNEVTDAACLKCHDAPAHHPQQATFTPSCGSCHLEHKGSVRLASTIDASCTQCHGDLHSKTGTVQYVRNINNFDHQHPEFSPLRPGATDPGQVKLNHYAHLRPNLAGPNGPVQMDCHDCHRMSGMEEIWPYAGPQMEIKAAAMTISGDPRPSRGRDYMASILYANQCAGCHVKDLQFDKRFGQAAPHDKPEVVQAFLIQKYGEYFSTHPGALSEPIAPERIISTRMPVPMPLPHNRQEWINLQVMLADRLLFDKGCKLCHVMIAGSESLPMVAKSSIPARWLPHADFDHSAHRMLTCISCHTRTPDSKETADILVPGIASCRSCHQDRGVRHDAASARCSECHSYHDWTKERPVKGTYTIMQLRAAR
ncbi:MAG TPA: hypothetical protein VMB18_01585 [Terriglobales bacterium]|nr:hypothetical protein [Terriglobales bacterium]